MTPTMGADRWKAATTMADVTTVDCDNGSQATELDALVIGAGFAGLYQLLCLRDRLGLSVKALEAGGGVGGTWYWNRYPARSAIRKVTFTGTPFRLT